MKIEIELNDEQFNEMLVDDLAIHILDMSSTISPPFFTYDKVEEKRKVKKLKKAFKLVSAWYGSKEYNLEELLK